MSFIVKLTDDLWIDLNRVKKIQIVPRDQGAAVIIFLDRDDDRHWTEALFDTEAEAQEVVRNLTRVSRDHSLLEPTPKIRP